MAKLGYPTRAAEMQMRLEPILQDSRYRTFVAVRGRENLRMIARFATTVMSTITSEPNSRASRGLKDAGCGSWPRPDQCGRERFQ